jgi:Holliday junction resolvasome, endonuclease subunit
MFAPRQGSNDAQQGSRLAGLVLGIDPGLTRCGYAIVQPGAHATAQPSLHSLGVLTTSPDEELPLRLAQLQTDLLALFDEFAPVAVAVERVFFNTTPAPQ